MSSRQIHFSPDGRALLNLGCAWRTAPGWNNVDSSPYMSLASRPWLASLVTMLRLLPEDRVQRLRRIDRSAVRADLRRGIPYQPASFDVVYHSHLLEHLNRETGQAFLDECGRVLKPGGVLRVVVPDLETLARDYVRAVDEVAGAPAGNEERHERGVRRLLDQLTRQDAAGIREYRGAARFLYRLFRGGAERTGELHRWMYDERSLARALRTSGFRCVTRQSPTESTIPGWQRFCLDTDPHGTVHKPESLYMEATK